MVIVSIANVCQIYGTILLGSNLGMTMSTTISKAVCPGSDFILVQG